MLNSRNGNQVYCVVTDKYGNRVTSDTVTLSKAVQTVKITQQPKNASVALNKTATVTVKATGDGLKYTWYVKAAGSSKFTKSSIRTSTYSVKMTNARNGNQIYCVVTDKYGNKVRTNTVTISKATQALKITQQPQDAAVELGEKAKVTVKATGDGLKYTWYVKSAGSSTFKKSSIMTASYSVTMRKDRDGNQVYCVVTDQYGNTETSATATLSRK